MRHATIMILRITVLLLALIWVFPASGLGREPFSEHKPVQVKLLLKWCHQFQFAGYYAAIEKGFFAAKGLMVELIEGSPDLNAVAELLSNRVDFAIETPSVLIKRHEGMPLVVVAAIFQHSPTVIITRRDSGLITPQNLKGKRIMLTPGTDSECMAMLVEEGIDPGKITFLPHNWNLDDLRTGRVDGQSAYLTNEPYLLNQNGISATLIEPINYGIDFYGDSLITTEDNIRNHPEKVEAFRQATIEGWLYAMNNPQEIAELILARYSKEKTLDQLRFEAEAMRGLIQPDLVEVGHMNPARWRRIADTFVKLGMMKDNYTLDGFIYTTFKEKIESEKQKRIAIILTVVASIGFIGILSGLLLVIFNRKLTTLVRQRTASLAASEHNYRAFFELASVGVAQIDILSMKYQKVNQKYCELVGYSSEELLTMTPEDITHPEDRVNYREQLRGLFDGTIADYTIEKRFIRKDGEIVWALLTVSPLWVLGKEPKFVIGVIQDITARKRAEDELIFAGKVFENSIEGIVVTDDQGTILKVNSAFSKITGYQADEAIGENPRILKSDKHSPSFYQDMWRQLLDQGQWSGEIWNRRKNEEAYPEWLTINAIRNPAGKITNYISIFHDISELKRQQEALEHQAQHDALTGLPNRTLIQDRLKMGLLRMKRRETKLALLYLDLDNFKHINDAFGHTAGDDLLVKLAGRLTGLLRAGDTIARIGGDEFLILLPEVESLDSVSHVAVRMIDNLKQPFYLNDIEFFVTASIGVTIAPVDGDDAVTLIKNADIAMYRAKSLGRNNYQFFTPELDTQAHNRMALEMKLRKGLEQGEFILYYQPIVHISSGAILGAEALVRWMHEGRMISPGEFIPLAEDSGLILPLGEWVLNAAARQAKIWQDAGYHLQMSVNLSSRQFASQDLLSILQQIYAATSLEPGRLYFEVTESMIIGDLAKAKKIMSSLRTPGTKFYLDDFGTGYSSLAYLKRLPIDGFKIDRSFIKDIVEDPDSKAIAAIIVSLSKTLNLALVAEGVETEAQRQILLSMGDMMLQGYLASKPVPADQFEALLKQGCIDWQ